MWLKLETESIYRFLMEIRVDRCTWKSESVTGKTRQRSGKGHKWSIYTLFSIHNLYFDFANITFELSNKLRLEWYSNSYRFVLRCKIISSARLLHFDFVRATNNLILHDEVKTPLKLILNTWTFFPFPHCWPNKLFEFKYIIYLPIYHAKP